MADYQNQPTGVRSPQLPVAPKDSDRVAILSKTLSPSSTIRIILPARIRSPAQNDVVFIGETFIQLREFLDNGQLADATAKLDFGARILTAKVISAKMDIVPFIDEILKQERDQEHYTIGGRQVEDTHPPQILVLSLVDSELVYVYAKEDSLGNVRFVFAKRALMVNLNSSAGSNRHMAVDIDSRALAIASSHGFFGVFKIRSVDEIKAQIDNWDPLQPDSFRPATEQRFVQVDGQILKMEFLRSANSEPNLVILLLLIANKTDTHILLYKWDTCKPLNAMKPMGCSGQAVEHQDDRYPLMLIPSSRPYSFLIVVATGLSYYENVHTEEAKRIYSRFLGEFAGPLTWVQWAKPKRHVRYLEQRDDLIIVREDGLTQFFQLDLTSKLKFNMSNPVGHLNVDVDTAFCMLGGPPGMGGDIMIVGGNMTDGGVYHVSARGVPERIQIIPNLAPLHDITIVPHNDKKPNDRASRLYMCGGKEEGQGEISEVRYGLAAEAGLVISHPDAQSADSMWTLQAGRTTLVLTSHATHTSILSISEDADELEYLDGESHPEFDFENPTLAAGVFGEDLLVQITQTGLFLVPPRTASGEMKALHVNIDCQLAGVFDHDGMIVTCRKVAAEYQVSLTTVALAGFDDVAIDRERSSKLVSDQPISITCAMIHQLRVVLVGTINGKLHIYLVTPDLNLKAAGMHTIQELHQASENAAIASMTALTNAAKNSALVLCGLRTGVLLCVQLVARKRDELCPSLDVSCIAHYNIGSTAVQISREPTLPMANIPQSALILCNNNVNRVTLYPNLAVLDYTMSPVWITARTEKAFRDPPISAISRMPRHNRSEASGLLVVATRDTLVFATLLAQEQAILRKISTIGIPQRLLYSRFLNKLVVAVESKQIHRPSTFPKDAESIDPGSRKPSATELVRHIGLQLVDPDLRISKGSPTLSAIVSEEPGETVSSLIEWTPSEGNLHHELIILSLVKETVDASGVRKQSGRIVGVNAKRFARGEYVSNAKSILTKLDSPITAVCSYRESSLVICTGTQLLVRHLDFHTQKWETLVQTQLPSLAKSVVVRGGAIFVATDRHSIMVYKQDANRLVPLYIDDGATHTNNIVAFDTGVALSSMWTAITGKGTLIRGVADLALDTGTGKAQAKPLFLATLPLHLRRLVLDPRHGNTLPNRFYGITTDGTLYGFYTLDFSEWELLAFLQKLSHIEKKVVATGTMYKKDSQGYLVPVERGSILPRSMHIEGDRLQMMVGDTPYSLTSLIGPWGVKSEEHRNEMVFGKSTFDDFRKVAKVVVGDVEDQFLVEAVIAWVRSLLTNSN